MSDPEKIDLTSNALRNLVLSQMMPDPETPNGISPFTRELCMEVLALRVILKGVYGWAEGHRLYADATEGEPELHQIFKLVANALAAGEGKPLPYTK